MSSFFWHFFIFLIKLIIDFIPYLKLCHNSGVKLRKSVQDFIKNSEQELSEKTIDEEELIKLSILQIFCIVIGFVFENYV